MLRFVRHLLRTTTFCCSAGARSRCWSARCYWSACSCCCAYCCCSPLLLLLLLLPCLTCYWLLLLLLCSLLGHVCTTTHVSAPSPMCSVTSMGPPTRPCHPVRPHGHPGLRTCSVQCRVTFTRVPVRPHVVLHAGTRAFAGVTHQAHGAA